MTTTSTRNWSRESSSAENWNSYGRRVRRMGILARRLGGRGRSGKKSNRSISSFPWTSRTSFGFRGFGGAAMPRSGGGAATGSGGRGCASGSPCGVRGTPRSRGAPWIFFVIASRSIAYTLRSIPVVASRAREGGVCHHVARRRARRAARVRHAAGSPLRRAARSARHARVQGHLGRRPHARAQLERARARLERHRPNAAPSGVRRAENLQRPGVARQRREQQQPQACRRLVAR